MSPARRIRLVPGALLLLALGTAVSGCGTAGAASPAASPTETAAIPTTAVTPPAGVALTLPGARLGFGQPATVGFAQNADRRTTLRLTVDSVRRGSGSDLAAYAVDEAARTSTPYYARLSVANLGTGDVSRAAVPLRAVASDGTLIASSNFTTPLPQCPSSALPSPFALGAAAQTCLVFLVPQGTTLTGLSFQPVSSDREITWRGTIARPTGKPRATTSPAR